MRPSSARRRRRAVAVALVALALAAPGAGAQEADEGAGLGLEVQVGYEGRTGGAEWMPVTVTLQPDRLVAGALAVEARTPLGGVRELRDVEVAVGSRNAYRFVVPSGTVIVSLDHGQGEPTTVRAPQPRDSRGDFLAGVLGGVPAGPPPLRSEAAAATGSWVGVDPQWVELSAGALEPLSGLVAEGRVLASLSEEGLRNVAAGVADGMDLVVVGPVPADLDLPWDLDEQAWALPAAQVVDDPGGNAVAATVVPAGRGRVASTDALLGQGELGRSPALWSALIEPRPPAAQDFGGMGSMIAAVLGTGSAGVPTLPWLAVFLVAYILIVGPVNGWVLARFGRRELAWVTVPAVTVVFTAGGWLGATGSQPPVGFAGSATAWVDGVASESVVAIGRAPTPGLRRMTLPGEGWEVRTEGTGEPAVVRRGASLQVDMELPALQPGGLIARRSVGEPAPLRLEATGTAEGLEVSVTNVAAATLSDVAVRTATASTRVGDLRPGQTGSVTVGADNLPVDDGWGRAGMTMPGDLGVEGPLALESVLADQLDGNPGLVWAVGTAASSGTGVQVEGRQPVDLGRYVAVAARATGAPRAHTVDRALLDAGQDGFRPAPLIVEGGGPVVLRYRIPPEGTGLPIRESLDREGTTPPHEPRPDLWLWEREERQWRSLHDALPDGLGGPDGYVSPLGEVYVRATGPLFPLFFSGMGLTVEEAP